jgi:ABC-type uncharacterized transport system permease subunit
MKGPIMFILWIFLPKFIYFISLVSLFFKDKYNTQWWVLLIVGIVYGLSKSNYRVCLKMFGENNKVTKISGLFVNILGYAAFVYSVYCFVLIFF